MTDTNQEFPIDCIDFSKCRIVGDEPDRKVLELLRCAQQFPKEIDWWFSLRSCTTYPENLNLRKPICIELYEFAYYLKQTIGQISDLVIHINAFYRSADRTPPLHPIDRIHRRVVENWNKKLEQPRNRVAAHRYTSKDGTFLTIQNGTQLWSKLDWQLLERARDQLNEVLAALIQWCENPINKNNLILAKHKL